MSLLIYVKQMRVLPLCCLIFLFFAFGCQSHVEKKTENDLGEFEIYGTVAPTEASIAFADSLVGFSKDTVDGEEKNDANHLEYNAQNTLFFSHAFIYRYYSDMTSDLYDEFWIYHNPDSGNLLYAPEDPMLDFVISDPQGNYFFFGTDGHGENTVVQQSVVEVGEPEDESQEYPVSDVFAQFTKTGNTYATQGQANGEPIEAIEYLWELKRMSETMTIAITEAIPVNYYQVYGFNRLGGDLRLPVNYLDFIGIFSKQQSIVKIEDGSTKLELVSYEYNPYFAEAADYVFFIRDASGEWKPAPLPLLKQ